MFAHVWVTYEVEAKWPKANGTASNELPVLSLTAAFDVKLHN
jgi:hypothetical protein